MTEQPTVESSSPGDVPPPPIPPDPETDPGLPTDPGNPATGKAANPDPAPRP